MSRHLTPILSSNDNTKAFLPTRREITEDFIVELRKTLKMGIHKHAIENSMEGKRNFYDDLTQDIIDLIIDFNPTQTYKSRKR